MRFLILLHNVINIENPHSLHSTPPPFLTPSRVDTHGNVVADETPDPRVGIDGRYFEHGRSYPRVLHQIHATEAHLYVYHSKDLYKRLKVKFKNTSRSLTRGREST